MNTNCAFGYRNRFKAAALHGSGGWNALPVSNLALDQGAASLAWRTQASAAWFTLQDTVQTWQVISLHRTNLTQKATWAIEIRLGDTVVWSLGSQWAQVPCAVQNGQLVALIPLGVQGDSLHLWFEDPDNPDGFVSIGLAYAGELWQPVRNMSWAFTETLSAGTTETTSLSGVEFPETLWRRRDMTVTHQSLDSTDLPSVRALVAVCQTGSNVLFLANPIGPDPYGLASCILFGRAAPSDIAFPYQAADRRSLTLTLKERL